MNFGACYISTGQKQVLHTLWQYKYCKNLLGIDEMFVKNLSANTDIAVAEAKAYAMEHSLDFEGVYNSPRFKKAEHLEKYGVVFKHKRKKGKSLYQGLANREFWEAWKENKEQMKKEGFFVSKWINKYDRDRKEIWYVFYYPMTE